MTKSALEKTTNQPASQNSGRRASHSASARNRTPWLRWALAGLVGLLIAGLFFLLLLVHDKGMTSERLILLISLALILFGVSGALLVVEIRRLRRS